MSDTEKKVFRDEERAEDFISKFLDEVAENGTTSFKRERLEHEDDGATIALWSGVDLIAVGITLHDSSNNIVAVCIEL